jgi:hypothetical protein
MIQQWYSSARYCALLPSDFRFTNRIFSSISDLPFQFRYITSLSLGIQLQSYFPDYAGKRCRFLAKEQQNLSLIKEIAQYFSISGPGNLQDLQVSVGYIPFFFKNLVDDEDWITIIRQSLTYILEPLRKIRVSGNVSMTLSTAQHLLGHAPNLNPFFMHLANKPHVEDFIAGLFTITREYFDLLRKEMSDARS